MKTTTLKPDACRPSEADRALYDEVHVYLEKIESISAIYLYLDGKHNADVQKIVITLGWVVDDYRAKIQRLLDAWWEAKA